MIPTCIFVVFHAIVLLHASAEKLTLDDSAQFKHLKCWSCNSTSCITNLTVADEVVCELQEPFCQVQRFYDGDTAKKFVRSCAAQCTPGCGRLPLLSMKWCVSCCSNSLCNTDRARAGTQARTFNYVSVSVFLFVYFVIKY